MARKTGLWVATGAIVLGGLYVAGADSDEADPSGSPAAETAVAAPSPSAAADTEPDAQTDGDAGGSADAAPVTVVHVVDGDTVYTSDGGKIRLIGYDTPETGECGFDEAKAFVESLALDQSVELVNPREVDDTDAYDRLLRYVRVGGQDLGVAVLEEGLANARYDGLDGYDAHPLQEEYRAISDRVAHVCGDAPPAAASVEEEPAAPAAEAGEPWNQPGPDLDCGDIGHPVTITGEDYHRLDRDGDGVGCDSSG